MTKYIAYCRKSTDEKNKQILSIDAQLNELKQFAQKEKLEVIEYLAESKTAKLPGRDQFEKLLKKIESTQANAILSWHPDRLARNSIDGGKIIYLLDTGKLIDLKFPSFWFDDTPQGKFMLSMAFSQAKYYVDNLSENVKRGNRQKLKLGIWPSKAPYGYLNNPKTRKIDLDPNLSPIIKKAFQKFSKGSQSLTEISRFLKKFGVAKKSGKLLNPTQIKRILTNRFYIGILNYGGETYKGSQQIFVSKNLFNQVQKQINRIEKPRKHSHSFPFTGLATCGNCGAAITAESHIKNYPNTRGKVKYVYYRCTKKIKPCDQLYISAKDFKKQLQAYVLSCSINKPWKNQFTKLLEKDKVLEKKKAKISLKQHKNQKTKLELKLNRLLDAYLDQLIKEKDYKLKQNQFFEQKLKLEEKIVKTKSKGSAWLEPMENFIKLAFHARKIARAKNNSYLLAQIAKNLSSNYSLFNKQLSAETFFPFKALTALPLAVRADTKSKIVASEGFGGCNFGHFLIPFSM